MSTIPDNKGLADANRRAAERARKVGEKMQAEALKKIEPKKAEPKTAATGN